MKLSNGVEWAVHACTLLAPLPPGSGLRAAQLAEFHGVPGAYMAKQLQALSKAGLVRTVRGAAGGYALARAPSDITLWDIVTAIEPATHLFRCTEIRQNGPCKLARENCTAQCPIAAAFGKAERTWRDALAAVTLGSLVDDVVERSSQQHMTKVIQWYRDNAKGVSPTGIPEPNSEHSIPNTPSLRSGSSYNA